MLIVANDGVVTSVLMELEHGVYWVIGVESVCIGLIDGLDQKR